MSVTQKEIVQALHDGSNPVIDRLLRGDLADRDAEILQLQIVADQHRFNAECRKDLLALKDAELAKYKQAVAEIRAKLDTIAKLGNGDRYGNSVGNTLAIEAIAILDKLDKQ